MPQSDALSLRGYAQVFRPQTGQLGALIQSAQKQKQFDQDQALKKQQLDQDWFDKNSKLGFADVRTELQSGLVDQFQATAAADQAIYKQAMRSGGMTPEHKMAIMANHNNYDTQLALTKSINSDLDKIDAAYKADPDLYDKAYLATRMREVMGSTWKREADGSLSFNRLAAKELPGLLDDPKALNIIEQSKRFQKGMGAVQQKYTQDKGTYWLDTVDNYTANVYQTEEKIGDGGVKVRVPKLDPETGLPIPNATPEAIRFWDSQGPQYEKKLTALAEQDGISRKEAFDKYVVKNLDRKSEATRHEKPQWEVYGPSGGNRNPKEFNFQVVSGNFGQLKKAADIGADGVLGKTAKSIDMQGLIGDKNIVFKGYNNEDVQGQFMGFYTDENGNDAIGIHPYDNVLKSFSEETKLIPLTEKNQSTVRNSITDPKLRKVYDDGLKEYRNTEKGDVIPDASKIESEVKNIQSAFSSSDNDSVIAESVRKILVQRGIKPEKIKADKGNWGGGDSIYIDGVEYNLSKEDDVKKFSNFLLDNAQNQFSKIKGKSDFTLEDPL